MTHKMTEKDVMVNGKHELGATLTIPETNSPKHPAIVIIGGTGKGNRDGNMKNFKMNIYKLLAHFLTELGFVTIRYDKRGIAQSKGDFNSTGVKDLIDDIISNVKYLENLPYVDRDKIILLGHSEGSILSTIVNTQYPVGGLILLSGAGVSIKTAMQFQNLALINEINFMKGIKGKLLRLLISKEKLLIKQNKLFNTISASTEDVLRISLQKFPAKWLREHLSYKDQDVLNMLDRSTIPILALTGEKDVQTNPNDLKSIETLKKPNITCRLVKNMDHILKEFTGETSILNIKKQYKNGINKPLHPQLKEELRNWCLNHFTVKEHPAYISEISKKDALWTIDELEVAVREMLLGKDYVAPASAYQIGYQRHNKKEHGWNVEMPPSLTSCGGE
jgi:uncharacterized protein